MRRALVLGLLLLGLMGGRSVCAAPLTEFNLLLESDADGPNGGVLIMRNYLSQLDFLNGNRSFQSSADNVPAGFSVVGFDITGTEFNLLLESDADGPNGGVVLMQNYLSQLDFLDGNRSFRFSADSVPAGFSVAGFASTGTEFNLLLESDADGPNGGVLIMRNYLSQLDFLNGNRSFQSSADNVPAGFSVVGFDITGTEFNLLLESDADGPNGGVVLMQNYLSQLDFLDGNRSFRFSADSVPAGFSVAGFASAEPTLASVPEPSTVALLGAALAGLGFARRRRRH